MIKSLTCTQKLSIQLDLAHVARKKNKKEETKTNKCDRRSDDRQTATNNVIGR